MDRRKAIVTAAAASLTLLAGGAGIALNSGIVSAGDNDDVGQLSPVSPVADVVATTAPPVTIYVDETVPAPAGQAPVVVAPAATAPVAAGALPAGTATVPAGSPAGSADPYEDDDDGEYEDDEYEDESEDEAEHEEEEEEEHEYEGAEDDD